MTIGVVTFPGSTCDDDCLYALDQVLKLGARRLRHTDTEAPADVEALVLPGGFSYGDYLRCGAMAAHTPVMGLVRRFAERGAPVLGICNGFQILTEARLLPGVLRPNASLRFICKGVHLRLEDSTSRLGQALGVGAVLRMPIAHHDGNYFDTDYALEALESRRQVVLRYCTPDGALAPAPSGAARSIAGVCNARGNVIGMMPHPERASEELLGSADGAMLLMAFADLVRQ